MQSLQYLLTPFPCYAIYGLRNISNDENYPLRVFQAQIISVSMAIWIDILFYPDIVSRKYVKNIVINITLAAKRSILITTELVKQEIIQ